MSTICRANSPNRWAETARLAVPILLWALIPVGFAQSPTETTADATSDFSIESTEKTIEALKADSTVDEATQASLLKIYEEALANQKSAARFESKRQEFERDLADGPGEISRIKKELDQRQQGKPPSIADGYQPPPKDAVKDLIESSLSVENARLAERVRQVRDYEGLLEELETTPTTSRDRMIEATRLLSEASAEVAKRNSQLQRSPKEDAELLAAKSRQLAYQSEIDLLTQQTLSQDLRRTLIEARRDLANSDLDVIRRRILDLNNRTQSLVNARITEAAKLTDNLDLESVGQNPVILSLIEETKTLAEDNKALLSKIADADLAMRSAEAALSRLRRDADNFRAQIEIGGMEDSFAQVILEMKGEIPKAQDYRAEAKLRRQAISGARLAAYHLGKELEKDPSREAQLAMMEATLKSAGLDAAAREKLTKTLQLLIETRARLKKDAVDGNRRLARLLGEIDLVQNETLAIAEDIRDYMGEKLIWVASSPPLGFSAFAELGPAFASIFGPTALGDYASAIGRMEGPIWVLASSGALLLLLPRKRLNQFLTNSSKKTLRISQDGLGNTLQALGATLWLALPWPAFLWFLGWTFSADTGSSNTVYAMSKALMAPAAFWLTLRFSSLLCRVKGVAESHFRWDRALLARCRRGLNAFALAYLLPLGLLSFWLNFANPAYLQGPGRLVFIISMTLSAGILWRLLAHDGGIFSHFDDSSSWFLRLRRFWTLPASALPLLLAVFAIIGHFLTAIALAYQIQNTNVVILLGILAYGLLTRWIMLKERRHVLQTLVAQREARNQTSGEASTDEKRPAPDEIEIAQQEEDEPDLATVGEQTRRLIGSVVTVGVLLACWLVWSEVIPLLRYLDKREVIGDISISDVISLGLITIVATVMFQNLPGLLEVVFFRALELDSGIRNALVTLCQYAVITIALMMAFQIIGLDWSQFGWIAAALSVGLGFGLQEVVANFVSGLILLFERPIRIGDIVTVAGVDGVVSRIQIRATTIINWDRKEFVVPNKEFITGTLLNWTLSSPVTRLVIPVGIAYGSDTRQAQELLLETARSCPEVLENPPPSAIFELFGDSTLNFSLRCFVAHPESRLETTHYLNSEIHRRFAESGIEIAFPQRDLRIRSVDPSVPWPAQMSPMAPSPKASGKA